LMNRKLEPQIIASRTKDGSQPRVLAFTHRTFAQPYDRSRAIFGPRGGCHCGDDRGATDSSFPVIQG
jgi:hypothetical protein